MASTAATRKPLRIVAQAPGIMIKILFLCLGNICRSPMAEAVFKQLIDEQGVGHLMQVDSAGTGAWHVGERAHEGTRRVLRQQGIGYEGRARQIAYADVDGDTYIIAMSQANVQDFRQRFGDYGRLYRLLDFAAEADERDVPDPYYTGNFAYVYQLVQEGCRGLLRFIREQEEI